MSQRRQQGGRAHRRRSRVQATGTTDFVSAAAPAVVTVARLRTPAQCLDARSQSAEQEQSQDQDDHAPMHTALSVPDFVHCSALIRSVPAWTLY